MTPLGRSSGLAFVIVGSFAFSQSCSVENSPDGEDGGQSTAGWAGMPGLGGATGVAGSRADGGSTNTAGTTSSAGTTGLAGNVAAGGATGVAGKGGATGNAGSNGESGGSAGGSPGSGGTGGGAGSGGTGAGASGSGAGGSGGVAGSAIAGASGAAGGGNTDVAPSAGCGMPAGLMSGRASIDVSGKMREYILLLPDDYDPNTPYRLIFGWHPWGGSAQQIENGGYFGLESVIDGQAILVAPEGQDYQDNGLGWGNEDGEDVDFLHAMLDRFGSELCIDENRIFSTGFSFGAMFSFTLACSQDGRMRAIAPEAGNATTSGRCEDGSRSVATMAFIGTDDSLLNGHRQAVQIFVERNGCSEQATPVEPSWCDDLGSNYQPCSCVEYQDCRDGYPVIECEYTAGHIFAPNAGATLWSFFSQF